MRKNIQGILSFFENFFEKNDWKTRISSMFETTSNNYIVHKFFSLIESEADFNKTFAYGDSDTISQIIQIASALKKSPFVSTSGSIRPSTSYIQSVSIPHEKHLVSLLHILNVCKDILTMLPYFSNNSLSSETLHIYTSVPIEFQMWKHENQVFWARLVQAFFERLNSVPVPTMKFDDCEENIEENTDFIVANWRIS